MPLYSTKNQQPKKLAHSKQTNFFKIFIPHNKNRTFLKKNKALFERKNSVSGERLIKRFVAASVLCSVFTKVRISTQINGSMRSKWASFAFTIIHLHFREDFRFVAFGGRAFAELLQLLTLDGIRSLLKLIGVLSRFIL